MVKSVLTNQSGRLDEPNLPDRSDLKTLLPAFDEIGKYSQNFWRNNGCQPSRLLLPGAIGGAFPGLQLAAGLPSQHEGQSHDAAQAGGIVPTLFFRRRDLDPPDCEHVGAQHTVGMIAIDDRFSGQRMDVAELLLMFGGEEFIVLDHDHIDILPDDFPNPIRLRLLILNLVTKNQMIGIVPANRVVVRLEIRFDDSGVHHRLTGKPRFRIPGKSPFGHRTKVIPVGSVEPIHGSGFGGGRILLFQNINPDALPFREP